MDDDNDTETICLEGSALAQAPPPATSADLADDDGFDGDCDKRCAEPQLSAADEEARRVLLRRIQRYSAVFPDEVAGYDLSGLSTMGVQELERTLEDVVFLVESRRTTAQARGIFLAGLSLGEASGPYLGLKLSGPVSLTATAASTEEIMRTVDEVALKYEAIAKIDPVHRLCLSLGQLALAVDQANRRAAASSAAGTPSTVTPAEPATSKPAPAPRKDNVSDRDSFQDL
jgi:hypothetical protein